MLDLGIGIFFIKMGDNNNKDIIKKISPDKFEKYAIKSPKIIPGIVSNSLKEINLNLFCSLVPEI